MIVHLGLPSILFNLSICIYFLAVLPLISALEIFTSRTNMASLHFYSLILFALTYCTNAFPAPPSAGDTLPSDAKWSKEAILALVGILVAILLFVLGILSKPVRRCIMNIFSCTYGMPLLWHPRSLYQSAPHGAFLPTVKTTILLRGYCGGVHRSGWNSMNGEHMWKEE
jgi:hypothetical protein